MTTTYGDTLPGGGVAAIFPSREAAHDAVRKLHNSDIHGTWIGLIKPRTHDASMSRLVTKPGDERVEAENWLARVFGEGDESLQDVLVRHGVGLIDPSTLGVPIANGAVVTVDGREATSDTTMILEDCGGRVIAGGDTIVDRMLPGKRNVGLRGDPVTTIREEIFYFDPAEDVVDGDTAAQRMAAQHLERPII